PLRSPKPDKPIAGTPTAKTPPGNNVNLQPPRHAVVEMNHDKLLVNRKPFLLRGIRYSNTPLKVLRDAGFNTLWCEVNAPEATLDGAVNTSGFCLVPDLPAWEDVSSTTTPVSLSRLVANFPDNDAVLFWHVGTGLTAEQDTAIARAATTIRQSDIIQGRPIAANVWDGFRPYSRAVDMLGVHRFPLMTSLELGQYREWLVQRTQMAEPPTD